MRINSKHLIYLTNAMCEETGHTSPKMLGDLGLNFGVWNGKDVQTDTVGNKMRLAGEYYPLNAVENKFIADDTIGLKNAWGLMGYSALHMSRKFAMPSFEISFFNPSVHRPDERDQYFESGDKAMVYVDGMAKLVEEFFQSNQIDGHVMVNEYDGLDDRHTVGLLIPFDYLAATFQHYDTYKRWLVEMVVNYDETFAVPKAVSLQ